MTELSTMTVPIDATVLDALRAIQAGGVRLCLAVKGQDEFMGVLTDGDVRRALLDGWSLGEPVQDLVTASPTIVGESEGRAAVLELMQAHQLDAIPIVSEGHVVGLHTLRDIVGVQRRSNWAVVMAGGRGARLGSLTLDTPKPMLTVAGRPILERIILHLIGSGIRKIAVTVNFKAEVIESYFGDGAELGCEIRYLREDPSRPLGTAGSLSLLDPCGIGPQGPVVVLNGDVLSSAPLGPLIDAHARSENGMTLGATVHDYKVPFGVLVVDDDARLTRIVEKPTASWRVGAGINVIEPALISLVPPNEPFDLPDLCDAAMAAGHDIGTFDIGSSWIDVGNPSDLALARGETPG